MTVFGARRAFFTGPGHQNGGFWGTAGGFRGLGTPKRLVLGHEGLFSRARDTNRAVFGVQRAVFAGRRWAKMPVLPNERLFFQLRMGKKAGFAQRRAVFPAADVQKARFCPTGSGVPTQVARNDWGAAGEGGIPGIPYCRKMCCG